MNKYRVFYTGAQGFHYIDVKPKDDVHEKELQTSIDRWSDSDGFSPVIRVPGTDVFQWINLAHVISVERTPVVEEVLAEEVDLD